MIGVGPCLRIEGVSRRFGGVQALHDVRFAVGPGEIVGLIGPNGAGKTTLANLVTGIERPDQGHIYVGDQEVTRLPVHRRALLGVGRTFQNLQIFGQLSVLDHVSIAGRRGTQPSIVRAIFGRTRASAEARARKRAEAALDAIGLLDLRDRPAADLSLGQQRLLDLARALALEPSVVLLDEPLSGLDGAERETLLDLLAELRRRGLATLWIEHDVSAVMRMADRIVVLDRGRQIAEGPPGRVAVDPDVVRAYLGTADSSRSGSHRRTAGETVLAVDHLHVWRGSTLALRDVSLMVRAGEMVAVFGPNGAGKSTLLGTLAGLFEAGGGSVLLDGAPVLGAPPETMLRRGVALVPERRQVFEPLTVEENLVLGRYLMRRPVELRLRVSAREDERLQAVFGLFPSLAERRRQLAGTLSGGEQQMVAIGRALMASPRLLMLDEPSLGLAPRVVEEVVRALANLRDTGTTVLVVEQRVPAIVRSADRAYLLDRGTLVAEGTAEEVATDRRFVATYLGDPNRLVTDPEQNVRVGHGLARMGESPMHPYRYLA